MHDPLKKATVKAYSKRAFFSDEQIFKVKQLYNSHNDVVYVPKKMRKVEVPEERLYCKMEDFPKGYNIIQSYMRSIIEIYY